ncbi:MAG: PCRF domain-containing protein, partial [Candidatus Omnitrophica bacterium]|nr:PCRF domain-containing protein [Candidatus Omnitrophota bacterium]
MFENFKSMLVRYEELQHLLASPEVATDKHQYQKLAKELSSLREPVTLFLDHQKVLEELLGMQKVLGDRHDKEFLELAEQEVIHLKARQQELETKLQDILAGGDEDLGRNCIVEIRPGTGGLEASLFAADLYRMYTKYAAKRNWAVESMALNENELGGFKEIVFCVQGKDAFKRLKYESGV